MCVCERKFAHDCALLHAGARGRMWARDCTPAAPCDENAKEGDDEVLDGASARVCAERMYLRGEFEVIDELDLAAVRRIRRRAVVGNQSARLKWLHIFILLKALWKVEGEGGTQDLGIGMINNRYGLKPVFFYWYFCNVRNQELYCTITRVELNSILRCNMQLLPNQWVVEDTEAARPVRDNVESRLLLPSSHPSDRSSHEWTRCSNKNIWKLRFFKFLNDLTVDMKDDRCETEAKNYKFQRHIS